MSTLGTAADCGLLAEIDAAITWQDRGPRRVADQGRYELDVCAWGWVISERRGKWLESVAMSTGADSELDQLTYDERLSKHTRECVAAWQRLAREQSEHVAEHQLPRRCDGDPKRGELFVHKRTGGLYVVEWVALDEADPERRLVVYRQPESERCWVRPLSEFTDGRFERATENGGAK